LKKIAKSTLINEYFILVLHMYLEVYVYWISTSFYFYYKRLLLKTNICTCSGLQAHIITFISWNSINVCNIDGSYVIYVLSFDRLPRHS